MGQLQRPDLLDLGGQPAQSDRYAPTMECHLHERPGTGLTAGPAVQTRPTAISARDPVHAGADPVYGHAVVPTSASSARATTTRLAYPDATPGVSEVMSTANIGPWATNPGIRAHAAHLRLQPDREQLRLLGTFGTTAPFNAKTVTGITASVRGVPGRGRCRRRRAHLARYRRTDTTITAR